MNEYIKKNILQVNKLHQNRSRRYLSASTWIHVPTFAVETCLIIVVMHIVVAQTVETLEIVLSVGLYGCFLLGLKMQGFVFYILICSVK